MTKNDIYVVVDTPKKAKKLKKVLEMFKEPIYLMPDDKSSAHNGSVYGWAYGFYDGKWQGFNTKSSIHNGKKFKKVSIKELKQILAKEHLKEGDFIIATIGKTEYVVKVESIWNNEAFINSHEYLCINDEFKHNVQKHGSFTGFKRYATPEEIALLEPKQKKLEVGKWYKHPNNEYPNWLVYYGENKKCYGFRTSGIWDDDSKNEWFEYLNSYPMVEATAEEVKSALVKEAKKRYKDGDEVKCLSLDSCLGNLDFKNVYYFHDDNELWISSEYYNIQVFKNGKWAEIIKPKEKINDSDIATIEALHDVILYNHKYDFNSMLLTNARELCKKLHNIIGD